MCEGGKEGLRVWKKEGRMCECMRACENLCRIVGVRW